LFLGATALSISGCGTQPATIPQTAYGKPEIVIASRDVDTMKSSLIREMARFGYQVDKDTPYLLEMSRTATDLITAHSVGSADSTHQRVVAYTIIKQGASTRIVADYSMRAQLPGGQVDTMSLSDNGTVSSLIQQLLNRLKETIESGKSAQE